MSEYRTPFITETNEPKFTDCQYCAGLMLVAEWTDGEAIHDEHGNTLDAPGLRVLRERIRTLSGDLEGGATLEALALGIARQYPDLPALPRTTAQTNPLKASFDEAWARLQAGSPAVLNGNPSRVKDAKSPLRSMQANDDYDHAIFLHSAQPDRAFVMDPLGRGSYEGQWVAREDLRQFASRYTAANGSPYLAMVWRGYFSTNAKLRRSIEGQVAAGRKQALDDASKAIAALPR